MEKTWVTEISGAISGMWLLRQWRVPLILALLLVFSGCAASKEWKYLPAAKAEERTIFVVAHGWHTGIALSRDDLGNELGFVTEYLPPGRYYEFGWGEAEFYQAEKVTPGIFLKAVFWRNPSVMHVVSVPVTPAQYFSDGEVVELNLSETGLKHLKDELRASFKFDERGRPYPLKKGPTGENRFFEAVDYYVITNTCNRWTAKLLESGGVPMDTVFTLRAASVMRQVKDAKKRYLQSPQFDKRVPETVEGRRVE